MCARLFAVSVRKCARLAACVCKAAQPRHLAKSVVHSKCTSTNITFTCFLARTATCTHTRSLPFTPHFTRSHTHKRSLFPRVSHSTRTHTHTAVHVLTALHSTPHTRSHTRRMPLTRIPHTHPHVLTHFTPLHTLSHASHGLSHASYTRTHVLTALCTSLHFTRSHTRHMRHGHGLSHASHSHAPTRAQTLQASLHSTRSHTRHMLSHSDASHTRIQTCSLHFIPLHTRSRTRHMLSRETFTSDVQQLMDHRIDTQRTSE